LRKGATPARRASEGIGLGLASSLARQVGLAAVVAELYATHELLQKAREGSLTAAERADLDEFIRVADLLAILDSRARQALARAGVSP